MDQKMGNFTFMLLLKRLQTFHQVSANICAMRLAFLLVENLKNSQSTSRTDRVPTKCVELDLLSHHASNLRSCYNCTEW